MVTLTTSGAPAPCSSEGAPPFIERLKHLPGEAGQGEVSGRLVEVAAQALGFYEHSFPMIAALFAEPALLARHRRALAAHKAGHHKANELLAAEGGQRIDDGERSR